MPGGARSRCRRAGGRGRGRAATRARRRLRPGRRPALHARPGGCGGCCGRRRRRRPDGVRAVAPGARRLSCERFAPGIGPLTALLPVVVLAGTALGHRPGGVARAQHAGRGCRSPHRCARRRHPARAQIATSGAGTCWLSSATSRSSCGPVRTVVGRRGSATCSPSAAASDGPGRSRPTCTPTRSSAPTRSRRRWSPRRGRRGARRRATPRRGGPRPRPAARRRRGCSAAWCSGTTARCPRRTRDAFRAAGLSHLVAASGTNVVLLAALAMALGTALGLGLSGRLWLVLGLIALYVPLAGGGPSIQRAGIMGAAAVAAGLVGRPASRWYALGDRGGGDAGARPARGGRSRLAAELRRGALAARSSRRAGAPAWCAAGVPAALADVTAMTAAATLATAPVIAAHFGQASLVAVPANLLAAPAVATGDVAGGDRRGRRPGVGCWSARSAVLLDAVLDGLVALAGYPLGYLGWVGATAARRARRAGRGRAARSRARDAVPC